MLTKNFARIWGMYCVGAPTNLANTTLRLVSNKNEIFNNDIGQSAGFYILRNENLVLNDFDLGQVLDYLELEHDDFNLTDDSFSILRDKYKKFIKRW